MAVSVVMPALEMAQETGKLLSWLKQDGDAVAKGDLLAEIETDKAVFELEATDTGFLAGVKAKPGEMVPVGQTIAWIVARGEQPPTNDASEAAMQAMAQQARYSTTAAPPPSSAPAASSAPSVTSGTESAPVTKGPGRASPKARRIAEEHGVDLAQLQGTGPDGSITGDDVLAAAAKSKEAAAAPKPAAAKPATPSTAPSTGMSTIGRLMAERTTQSWTQTPHFFLVREIDASAMIATKEKLGAGYTITDVLISATAKTLAKHPKLNASWTAEGVRLNPDVNISIAVAVTDGVVGAVIPKADTASFADIAAQRKQLAERARAGRLKPADVAGGTFTISNLGMYKVDAFSAIITPPQAAILAVGRITDRVVPIPAPKSVAIGIRPILTLTLSSDHRVVDGAQSAAFLNDLAEALEKSGVGG